MAVLEVVRLAYAKDITMQMQEISMNSIQKDIAATPVSHNQGEEMVQFWR